MIASFEVVDLPLIRYVAGTGKPMIISTAMADAGEIEEAIAGALEGGCRELAILHCVSVYPAPSKDYNLRIIGDMVESFGLKTMLSKQHIGQRYSYRQFGVGCIGNRKALYASPQLRRSGRQFLSGTCRSRCIVPE